MKSSLFNLAKLGPHGPFLHLTCIKNIYKTIQKDEILQLNLFTKVYTEKTKKLARHLQKINKTGKKYTFYFTITYKSSQKSAITQTLATLGHASRGKGFPAPPPRILNVYQGIIHGRF
jgi:hypothetical protein